VRGEPCQIAEQSETGDRDHQHYPVQDIADPHPKMAEASVRLVMALNASVGTARYRQLSGAFRKTYAKRREIGKE
jgi:hypothetical protein